MELIEAEREKQLGYLQQQAVRRMLRVDLSRGWSAWRDLYSDEERRKRVLRGAAARLQRPRDAS